ncbi:MAG: hypothetical protein O3C48_05405 [Crenarchaeota archaeon]|nr:hypothetical protein [Thermoproteota archaeon]
MKPVIIISIAVIFLFIPLESNAIFTPVIPVNIIDKSPTIDEFKKFSQNNLLADYNPYSLIRKNGERIDSYYFYDNSKSIRLLVYIEDSTYEKLKNYRQFNSDYINWFFETENGKSYYIYAERNGNSCLFPAEKYSAFWAGTYFGCDGGAVEVKDTDNGFALYVKFFVDIPKPTLDEPYSLSFDYVDITKSDENGVLKKYEYYHFPNYYQVGKAVPIIDSVSKTIKVNSGIMKVGDFLFKPFDILTENLKKNPFVCADNTISVSTYKESYTIDENARINVSVNSDLTEKYVKLKLYDMNLDLIHEQSIDLSSDRKALFLIDLNVSLGTQKIINQVYKAEVEYGIDGPKASTYFAVGNIKVPEKPDACYFYLTYDAFSRSASFLIHVDDPSNTGYDQVQIFVDKQGDSIKSLDANDVSFSIDTKNIGAHEYTSDGGWITNVKHKAEGRILQSNAGYNAFIHIDDVSDNFRFAIDQIDHTGYELKSTRVPSNGFSTNPEFWADVEISNEKATVLAADKYQPTEIIATQLLDVNLILVGDTWNPDLKKMIEKNLNTKYSPFIASELNRAGITYHYDFNFHNVSESDSNALFNFVKAESKSKLGLFPGEFDFKEPWGFGPWIQANHTEWITNNVYKIDYKTMDAEKMEDYIQKNIILQNNQFTKPTAVNLVFISGDLEDIDFLHTYDLLKKDPSTNKYHDAIGMMGFGGKYNFYFFDLYSVPWHDWQGWYDLDPTDDYGYDKTWKNHMINLHDIHTTDRHARLISDYVNNSTSMIITPSYLYGPVYKSNYIIDITLVAELGSTASIPVLTEKFFDENKIKKQLKELAPFSEWQVNFSVYNIANRELPDSIKDVIASKKYYPIFEDNPEFGKYAIIDAGKLKKALTELATTQSSSKFKDFKDIEESTWTIPVVIVVANSDDKLFVGQYGGLGIAPAHPDDPRQPCCSIGVTTDYDVWTQESSVTDLGLHEIGHTLSFMHPFMGFDDDGEFKTYDYFKKWYWGVMGYNEPINGCGLWYDILVDTEDQGECGIPNVFFTQWDKDNYSRGVAVYLIKTAKINIYNSMIDLERNGQDLNKLPETTKNTVSKIESLLDEADSKLKGNDLISNDGAIKTALEAAILSSKLAKIQNVSYNTEPETPVKPNIPSWVKNNAEWWANDAISQSEFLQAIEFLIKQKILIIPDITTSQTTGTSVPEWIKNNARWWADGSIDDSSFISGIQFLIKNGIIRVS